MIRSRQQKIHQAIKKVLLTALSVWLLIASPTLATEAVEPYYRDLQERLVADGFDATWIAQIYSRPEIVFETKNVSLYFVQMNPS